MDIDKPYWRSAVYFEELMGTQNAKGEVDELEKIFKEEGKCIKDVLDFGCGTGLHSNILADRGYNVTGIDISPIMIDIAKSKTNKSIKYVSEDILKWKTRMKFDAIISMWNVIGYIPHNNIDRILSRFHLLLRNNGLLIFDCFNGIMVIGEKPQPTRLCSEVNGVKIIRQGQPIVDFMKQTFIMRYEYEIINKGKREKFYEDHNMVFYTPNELQRILNNNKFQLIKITNVKDGSSATKDDWDIRYITRRMI